MAGDRTLTLKILGDTKDLVDSLGKASKSTDSFAKQVGDISGKIVKSFALIGGAVAGLSIAFAKAAAEDQQAANKLALTLKSVTNASQEQIKAVGDYITKTSLATGITDDELRPAFERLARSTKDAEQSQRLLNLALDLSAATGKPLEAVTNALAKAYDGSYTSLSRLGLGLDEAAVKAKDFDAITQQLNATYGEFSEQRSEEAIVKFQRLQVAIQEAKEAVGAALLPVFIQLGDWLLKEGVPRLNAFIAGLTGDNSLSYSFSIAQKDAEEFGKKMRSVFDTFIKYRDVLAQVAIAIGTVWAVSKITAAVQATVAAVKVLIGMYNALRVSSLAAGVAAAFALNPAAGIAAGAAAIAGMGLLIQQMNQQNDLIGTGGGGGVNLGNRPFGGGGGGGGAPTGGGTVDWVSPTRGGGGGRSLSDISGGLVTSPEDLVRKLTSTSERLSQIQFLVDTGQISKEKGRQLLAETTAEFRKLEEIGNAFRDQNRTPTAMGGQSRGENVNPTVVINVNSPSVIDEQGFGRAVIDALNSIERRQGGGASALQYL